MVQITDYVAIAALAGTILGLVFTASQIRKNTAILRGNFSRELYEPFFLHDDWYYIFSLINKGEDIFPLEEPTSEEEKRKQKAVERLFAHLDIICSLYRRGLINKDDMQDFDYNIQRVYNHQGFPEYEKRLDSWRKTQGLSRGPYSNFFSYTEMYKDRLRANGRGNK